MHKVLYDVRVVKQRYAITERDKYLYYSLKPICHPFSLWLFVSTRNLKTVSIAYENE